MLILGLILSVFIGVVLGLLGGGGSILAVPVLVYTLDVSPVYATAYSLCIVGVSALIGSIGYFRDGNVSVKTAVVFGIPSIVSVYLTRKFIIPLLPDIILSIGSFELSKDVFLMVLFAIMMVLASVSMIKGRKEREDDEVQKFNYPMIFIEGILIGFLTGLIGAGGGFIIIPALVVLSKLKMKLAIGTSLLIIAGKSLIGFLGDVSNLMIDWKILITVTVLAAAGIFIGKRLSKNIEGKKLKPVFGWFVLVVGVSILFKELLN